MSKNHSKIIIILGHTLAGTFTLFVISFIQKLHYGINPYRVKVHIIPCIIGCCGGGLIGYYIWRIKELNTKLKARIQKLESFLPICAYCKKIKITSEEKEKVTWEEIDQYITEKTSTTFSHGICPDCYKKDMEKYNNEIKSV